MMAWLHRAPAWEKEGAAWPNRTASRFLDTENVRWHIQEMGTGPAALLLHGTGAASHSYAPLVPYLKDHLRLLIVDLPGHGFSRPSAFYEPSLLNMVHDLLDLLARLDAAPQILVGHSAGAALAAELHRQMKTPPDLVAAINGAFTPFDGLARYVAPAMARLLHLNPLTAPSFALGARMSSRVTDLLVQTGSAISEEQTKYYAELFQCSAHVSGALGMMAAWQLSDVEDRMAEQRAPFLFIVGEEDKTVPPTESVALADQMKDSRVIELAGFGHLVHEEAPETVASALLDEAKARKITAVEKSA